MSKKHIAKSGAKEGQWVECPAQVKCRNGGMHISSMTFDDTKRWLAGKGEKYTSKDVTREHVEAFLEENLTSGKTQEESFRESMNKLTAYVDAALGEAKPPVERKALIVKGTSKLTPTDWDEIKKFAAENNVKLSWDSASTGTFPSGRKQAIFTGLRWEGNQANVAKLDEMIKQGRNKNYTVSLTSGSCSAEAWQGFLDMAYRSNVEVTHGPTVSYNSGIFGFGRREIHFDSGVELHGNKADVESLSFYLTRVASL